MSTFLNWALTQAWMLHGPVADEAARILVDRAEGRRVPQDAIHRVVAGRDQRHAHVLDDRHLALADGHGVVMLVEDDDTRAEASPPPPPPPRGMSRRPGEDAGYFMSGAVALVPVDGIICKYADQINGMSQPQGCTPLDIRDAVTRAAADPRSKAIVLDIDSPGGTVAGGEDVVEAIRDAKTATTPRGATKPVIAYGHDLCASGALLLASQCHEFWCSANATVGSIGVLAVYRDRSAIHAARGEKVHVISSGPYKGAGAEGTPLTDAHLAKFQQRINDLATWFVTRVAEGRGMTVEAVQALATGETWVGKMAADIGLADGVTGFRELVAKLNAEL